MIKTLVANRDLSDAYMFLIVNFHVNDGDVVLLD